MSSVPKSQMRGLLGLVALFVGAYFMWRAEVLPGVWDLQHWGQDVEAEARAARAAHRAARLAEFDVAEFPAGSVVFLGSSTIERFPLAEFFAGAPVLNRGIGDEPAELLLERIDRGIDWSQVSGVVLYGGSVDLRRLGTEPDELVARVANLLIAIETRVPAAPVLLLGLLSQRDRTETGRESLERTNLGLRQLADVRGAAFLDTDRAPLTAPDGSLDEAHSADRLHLNRLGYQVLGRWIRQNGGPLADLLSP